MKRKLLTQIKNEWRDNIWLVIELAVVCAVIWIVGALVYIYLRPALEPVGSDYHDVYQLDTKTVNTDSPYFTGVDGEEHPYNSDLRDLIRRLRENPNVEEVTFHNNGLPYNYNYYGRSLIRVDKVDSVAYFANQRTGSPALAKVMGLRSLTGKSTQQLMEILSKGELLIAPSLSYSESGRDVMDLLGAKMVFEGDSSNVYRIGDIVENVRRTEYEPAWGGTLIFPVSEDDNVWGRVALKVKHGRDAKFKEDFRNHPELRRQRNVYLSDLTSLADIREGTQRSVVTQVRLLVVLILFLLATIFLGLLGSFWFRMQQRVGEIAIRKVCGATSADIFRRILGEGMILLSIAVIIVSALVWPFMSRISFLSSLDVWELILIEAVAVALVAAGIVVSLWWPARKAMRIEPAIALKSE